MEPTRVRGGKEHEGTPLTVSRETARRFLLEAQGLGWKDGEPSLPEEPYAPATGTSARRVLGLVRRLECVQLDPVAAVERNQHLVLAARLPGYRPALLERLLVQRRIFEYWANAACVLPMEDYPILEATRRRLQKEAAPHLAPLQRV